MVTLTKEGSTKIVNELTPRGRGSCAGAWPYKSYGECALYPNLSYTAHCLLLVLKDYKATFLCQLFSIMTYIAMP